MKQEVLFLLLNDYADWEGAFLSISLNAGVLPGNEVKYISKTVAPTLDEVRSIGGSAQCRIIVFRLCLPIMRHWF